MVILRWIFVLVLIALILAGVALIDAADRLRRPLRRRFERRSGAAAMVGRERLVRRAVVSAIVLTQAAWFVGLIFAAWVFVF